MKENKKTLELVAMVIGKGCFVDYFLGLLVVYVLILALQSLSLSGFGMVAMVIEYALRWICGFGILVYVIFLGFLLIY